jgi:exodeoxyribonuclease VII small subunit
LSENHDPGWPGSPRAQREQEATEAKAGRRERQQAPDSAAATDAGAGQEETPLGFRQAMEELEGILERIEGEEIDIDQLAQELRRAAQLLDVCRGKIRKAEVEVTQIVQSLTESGESSESGETGESGAASDESGGRGGSGGSGGSGDEGGRGGS